LDSIVFSEAPAAEDEEIVATVDANGNADGGHFFTKIDENNFYIDDIKYTAVCGNLEVTGYDPAYFSGTATIISKLTYNGRTLNVTAIAERTFYNCTILNSVTIPSSVTSIGYDAFSRCSSLKDVYCLAESVSETDSYAFYNSPISSATLHVPAASVNAYKTTLPWSDFGIIVAIE